MGVHYQPPSSTSIYIDNTAWALTHGESRGGLGLGLAQSAECPEGWWVGSKRQDNLSFWEPTETAYQPDAAVELPAHRFSSLPEPPASLTKSIYHPPK